MFSEAFYSLLINDSSIVASLNTFNSRPAIFTYEPVPKDVDGTYIITAGEVSDESEDTKDTVGRRIVRDIRIYAGATGDAIAIESLAERVRTLFHRSSISITGFKTIYVNVSGPITADEEDVYGRILSVELLLDAT